MKYYYFVYFESEGGKASIEMSSTFPIKRIEDVREMEARIKEKFEIKNLIIVNYILLREERI